MNLKLDVQGHRGCRGLLPENTIEAFTKAIEMGVTTLEMDLVITQDNEVLVSHEPFFSHEISTSPEGTVISKEEESNHNIYKMSYDQCKLYDVGSIRHSRFPEQQNLKTHKPRFVDVLEIIESKVSKERLKKPLYNVEIKRKTKWDNEFHPDVRTFTELVVKVVQNSGIKDRIVIQSFDIESLQIAKELDPNIELVLLIENTDSIEKNIEKLGFTPAIYSPYFVLITEATVQYCKDNNIRLIPWTVNEKSDMKNQIKLGVDGIISDYPDRLIEVVNDLGIEIL